MSPLCFIFLENEKQLHQLENKLQEDKVLLYLILLNLLNTYVHVVPMCLIKTNQMTHDKSYMLAGDQEQ